MESDRSGTVRNYNNNLNNYNAPPNDPGSVNNYGYNNNNNNKFDNIIPPEVHTGRDGLRQSLHSSDEPTAAQIEEVDNLLYEDQAHSMDLEKTSRKQSTRKYPAQIRVPRQRGRPQGSQRRKGRQNTTKSSSLDTLPKLQNALPNIPASGSQYPPLRLDQSSQAVPLVSFSAATHQDQRPAASKPVTQQPVAQPVAHQPLQNPWFNQDNNTARSPPHQTGVPVSTQQNQSTSGIHRPADNSRAQAWLASLNIPIAHNRPQYSQADMRAGLEALARHTTQTRLQERHAEFALAIQNKECCFVSALTPDAPLHRAPLHPKSTYYCKFHYASRRGDIPPWEV